MPTLAFPSAEELLEVEQDKLPVLTQDDPVFEMFPIVAVDSHLLLWEQKDNYVGLQNVRGLNGQPGRISRVGAKRYKMEPGVYGDFVVIDEDEITRRRALGQFVSRISVNDLVADAQDQLLNLRVDRIRLNLWTLLATGTFSVYGQNGQLMHTDTFSLQTASAAVAWGTFATATPLVDFRTVKLKARGRSVDLGRTARAFGNTKTVNKLLGNLNANDLFGKRLGGGNTILSLNDVNKIFLDNDLPQVEEYDRGYLDSTGTFQAFIPDDKMIVVGTRTNGQKLGEYRQTFNAVTGSSGPYTKVFDRSETTVPPTVEVHDGHNGGPVIYFPGGVVILSV